MKTFKEIMKIRVPKAIPWILALVAAVLGGILVWFTAAPGPASVLAAITAALLGVVVFLTRWAGEEEVPPFAWRPLLLSFVLLLMAGCAWAVSFWLEDSVGIVRVFSLIVWIVTVFVGILTARISRRAHP